MSLSLRIAVAHSRGDPGLFSFLGKIAKGVVGAVGGFLTGGPVGAITSGVKAVLGNAGQGAMVPAGAVPIGRPMIGASYPTIMTKSPNVIGGRTPSTLFPMPSLPGIGFGMGLGGAGMGGGMGGGGSSGTGGHNDQEDYARNKAAGTAGAPPGRGYHLNRHGYFVRGKYFGTSWGTFIEAGSRWVKNRRRNPLNPRALSRGMHRLLGFKKAVTRVERTLHRLAPRHHSAPKPLLVPQGFKRLPAPKRG